MAKSGVRQLEGLGWGFVGICFVVLLAPGIYLAWQVRYESVSLLVPLSVGIFGAAVAAGLIAWAANSIIQWRLERARKNERRKAKGKKGR